MLRTQARTKGENNRMCKAPSAVHSRTLANTCFPPRGPEQKVYMGQSEATQLAKELMAVLQELSTATE